MEFKEIITLVVSSSVLSAVLTISFNFVISNINYKREYYKKIIERRINAQDKAIALTNEIRTQIKLTNGPLCNKICASGEEYLKSFVISLPETVNHSLWLSNKLADIILEFNVFIYNEILAEIKGDKQDERDDSLIEIGLRNHEKIRNFRFQIERQLMYDFAKLDNVRSFVKEKQNFKDKKYWLKN